MAPFKSSNKNKKSREEQVRERFRQILGKITPVDSLPDYPREVEEDGYTAVVTVVRGNPEKIVNDIFNKWNFHHGRSTRDPDSARALRAFDNMLESGNDRCIYTWGVNMEEHRLHRSRAGDCMYVCINHWRR